MKTSTKIVLWLISFLAIWLLPSLEYSYDMAMPALPLIAAGLGLIDPISKILAGRKQRKMARGLKQDTYIPPGLQEAESLARVQAFSPRGYNQGVTEANLRKSGASASYNVGLGARGAGARLSAQGGIADKVMNKTLQLGEINRNQGQGRIDRLMRMLGLRAGQESFNRQQFQATKSSLLGAGMQNQYQGIAGLANPVADMLGVVDRGRTPRTPTPTYG